MTSRVTQCPNCQTSFRVTDAQLDIANGAVRCGSCLHIFNATQHWLGQQPSPPLGEAAATNATNNTQSFDDEELRFDDELGFDDIDFDDLDNNDPDNDLSESASSGFSAANGTLDEQESFTARTSDEFDVDDAADLKEATNTDQPGSPTSPTASEADASHDDDDFLIDDGDDHFIEHHGEQMSDQHSPELALSDSFLDLDNNGHPSHVFNDLKDLGSDDEEHAGDDWVSKLLEDDEASHDHAQKPTQSQDTRAEIPEFDDLLDDLPSESDSADPEATQTSTEATSDERFDVDLNETFSSPITAGERIGGEQPLLNGFEPEPLELATEKARQQLPLIGWSLAITATLAMLAGQFLYFNFDKLARDDNWRPLLSQSCQWLGCEIPPLNDLRRVQLSNLIVRSHPSIANALVVDAIVSNRAPFAQAFPALELRFTDIEGQAVASRRFQPGEYLAGELSGLTMMPVKQPIHIGLEIVDPGPNAVNYQLVAAPLSTP